MKPMCGLMKGINMNPKNRQYKGLKLKTWATIVIALELILIISAIGFRFKVQEAQASTVAQLSFQRYQEPTLAPQDQQERAVSIIKNTWRKDWYTGYIIAKCESGLRETVVNSIGATGYFQVLVSAHNWTIKDMQNGIANSSFAYTLYKEQGLSPWVSSKECWGGQI